jgi:hypothetical protein
MRVHTEEAMSQMPDEQRRTARTGRIGFVGVAVSAVCLLGFSLAARVGVQWLNVLVVVAYFIFFPSVLSCIWSALMERPRWTGLLGVAVAAAILTQRSSWVILDSLLLLPFYGLIFVSIYKVLGWRRTRRLNGAQ